MNLQIGYSQYVNTIIWRYQNSSMAVSLTYLRGLEVSELEEQDMPILYKLSPKIETRG